MISFSIYGPNTEIEWNREGARGFCLLARIPPQTALAVVADKAAKLADRINSNLDEPLKTARDRKLTAHSDEENDSKLVTADPSKIRISREAAKSSSKAAALGKEPEPLTKSKKSRTLHSNAKIQQLYNTHNNKPLLVTPRKSPGTTKRGTPAKRRKKLSDVADAEKPLLMSPPKQIPIVATTSLPANSLNPMVSLTTLQYI